MYSEVLLYLHKSGNKDYKLIANYFPIEHIKIKEIIEDKFSSDSDKINLLVKNIDKIVYLKYYGEYQG